jgi:hypothetical protein
MKNPVTGMEMRLEMELRALEYRGESIPVIYHYYGCGTDPGVYKKIDAIGSQKIPLTAFTYSAQLISPFEKGGVQLVSMQGGVTRIPNR